MATFEIIIDDEAGKAWRRFIGRLKARNLSGVEVGSSDTHGGLRQTLGAAFPGLIGALCTEQQEECGLWGGATSRWRRSLSGKRPSYLTTIRYQ